jgi:hypothetical protein
MAGVATILTAVQTTVAAVPGINRAERDIPAIPIEEPDLPAALCRIDPERTGVIELGLEQWRTYPVRIDVLVARKVSDQIDQAELYAYVTAVADAFVSNVTVQDVGAVQAGIEWRIGLLAIWDVSYWAASLFLTVEEHVTSVPVP